jgi:large repetitive protein
MIRRPESKVESVRRENQYREAKKPSDRKRRLTLEGLEKRNLMASLPINAGPNNVGTIVATIVQELEGLGEVGENDTRFTAQALQLGTAAGQQQAIDVRGTLSIRDNQPGSPAFTTDVDTYRVDLRQGDILDISIHGSAGTLDVFYGTGNYWFGGDAPDPDDPQAFFYPSSSPLQNFGNFVAAQVVPATGTYYIQTSPNNLNSTYTMGLRVYRPVAESLPIGQRQKVFLDFTSQIITANDFSFIPAPVFGRTRLLEDFYTTLANIDPTFANIDGTPRMDVIDRVIDKTLSEVRRHFDFIKTAGNNGDFDSTGIPGQYGIEFLNSRDNPEAAVDPQALRVTVTGLDAVLAANGASQTIDVGNFEFNERVYVVLDGIYDEAGTFPISSSESFGNAFATRLAVTISHEVGHAVGLRHTEPTNALASIIDTGGTANGVRQRLGVGIDGIFGTADDVPINFRNDLLDIDEGLLGTQRVVEALANVLVSGRAGNALAGGRVFNDFNADGSGTNDPGIAGVRVYVDVNGNGVFDPSEPSSLTDSSGNYSLAVAPTGTVSVVVIPPTNFSATTATSATIASNATPPSFGFRQINPDITGTAFIDTNGNGVRDTGETGATNVYIYADLDGDNRPDLGEPSARTNESGVYTLRLVTPGTFAIREVLPAGFEQTFPSAGEHLVTFNGTVLNGNFDFGLLPSQDFGDAPDTYGTTLAVGGASHGVIQGLRLGAQLNREADGRPSVNADGDTDEDAVRFLSPFAPGQNATIEVDVLNSTGATAYLQGFFDFGRNGNFSDAADNVLKNIAVPSSSTVQTLTLTISVPATASLGQTYARFRLSPDQNVGPTGFVAGGEVEDHALDVQLTANLATPDSFTVNRNTLSNPLQVLDNDFVTSLNGLRVVQLQTINVEAGRNTVGTVSISSDGQSVFYTPQNGFVGRDVFIYSVVDTFGNRASALVEVNVGFQTAQPIAVDDIFTVAQGTSSRPLNVLDNDVESIVGGLRITSVGGGDQGGQVTIVGGGQSLRYTPTPGFAGTEQFFYSIQDAAGNVDTATVTVNVNPGSEFDDLVNYELEILDDINEQPISNLQVGQTFLVRVSVDDLTDAASAAGVFSGFIDLLYSRGFVVPEPGNGNGFPFDIQFGRLFDDAGNLVTGNDQVPGIINEVGGAQNINNITQFTGSEVLFTIRMRAVAAGLALFAADPADDLESETTLIADSNTPVSKARQRFGRAELEIFPGGGDFTSAIEDSFPDGRDSLGRPITSDLSQAVARLNILSNDNLGTTGVIREFSLVTSPTLGTVTTNNNGTATLNDDFLEYRPNALSRGLEKFTYAIVTEDGVRSTANVTISVGNPEFDVEYRFRLVDESGNPINSVSVGQRFGVEIIAEEFLDDVETYVYAAFQDILYTQDLISPSTTLVGGAGYRFDFDVDFSSPYDQQAGVGTARLPGVIDEFGSLDENQNGSNADNPSVVATLFFEANSAGTASVTGAPADNFPSQQTLVLDIDTPIEPERIKYGKLSFPISGSALRNQSLPSDVNNDGDVSAIDALMVINYLRRTASRSSGESVVSTSSGSLYPDVNGDGDVTALDALHVINHIRRGRRASGESASPAVLASTGQLVAQTTSIAVFTPMSQVNSDSVFTQLSGSDEPLDLSASDSETQSMSPALLTSIALDDDDDDDIFDTLANDQISSL